MLKCPNCNELLGGNLTKCPFCSHEITEEERTRAKEISELEHEEAEKNAMAEYSRRIKLEILVSIAFFVVGAVTLTLLAIFDKPVYAIAPCILFPLMAIISMKKLRIGMCPYCESVMGRGMIYRTHCPRCGGRLR